MKPARTVRIHAEQIAGRTVELHAGQSIIGMMAGNDYEMPRAWILYDPADDPELAVDGAG